MAKTFLNYIKLLASLSFDSECHWLMLYCAKWDVKKTLKKLLLRGMPYYLLFCESWKSEWLIFFLLFHI